MLATLYRGSNQVLAIRGSYHGKSHSAIAVTGNAGWSGTSFSPFQVTYVHGGYKVRSPFGHLPDHQFIRSMCGRPAGPAGCRSRRKPGGDDRRAHPGGGGLRKPHPTACSGP